MHLLLLQKSVFRTEFPARKVNSTSSISCNKFEILTVDEEGEPCELSHDPPMTINVDGEPCLQTPAILEFYPNQLWIRGAHDVSWDKG